MIAFSDANADKQPDKGTGEGGGPYLTKTQENNIIKSMLSPRRRWKLTKAAKQEAIAVTIANMGDDDGRVRNTAVANLIKMELQNQTDELKAIDKKLPDMHNIGGAVEHRHTATELLTEPEYVEWLRERERNSDARLVCPNGHQGNGHAVDDGPARNGH